METDDTSQGLQSDDRAIGRRPPSQTVTRDFHGGDPQQAGATVMEEQST